MTRVFMIGMSTDKGGVETYISNLCSNLDASKYEIVYHWPEMKINGTMWSPPKNRHNYYSYRKFWSKFYRVNRFDVVYFNTCDIVSIDQLKFAKAAGVPVRIIHSHNTGNQQAIRQKMSLLHRLWEKRNQKNLNYYATHLLACSEAAGNWMFDGRPYRIIRNGIQLNKYQYSVDARMKLRREYDLGDGVVVGIVGRLDPQKNPMYSIEVLKSLFKIDYNAKAVFVGDGELRESVERKADDYGILDRITFVGAVDNVHEWMSAIDCLLMPSLFEGLPFVLVEAQAEGLPCVVSAAVSKEANITGFVQYVSLEQTPEHWADIILETCEKRSADTAEILAAAGYSIEMTARQVEDIICDSLK